MSGAVSLLTVIGPLQKVPVDGLYGWLVVNTVAWVDRSASQRNAEDPLNIAEMVREPSSVPGKVTIACRLPGTVDGDAGGEQGPLPALVPVLSWKVTVPPDG